MNARPLVAIATFAFMSASVGCSVGAGDDTVRPSVELIDRTRAAISTTAGGLASINGTYAGTCHGHDDGQSWSLAIVEGAPLAFAPLTVTKNDADCVLSVTQVVSAGTEPESFTATFYGTPAPIVMSDEYGAPKPFMDGTNVFRFYGNAKLSSTTFASSFTLTLVVSDAPDTSGQAQGSSYAQVSASSVSASDVLPPNDTVDMTSVGISIDAEDLVLSRGGDVVIQDGNRPAAAYAVVASLGEAPTFVEVDSAWQAAAQVEIFDEASHVVPMASFLSVGDDLTGGLPRWLVLRRDEGGVPAYQVIKITFQP